MSPSDPSEPPLPTLIQGLLSLLAFGVKREQQLPALCGERLLGRQGGIPWHQHSGKKGMSRKMLRQSRPEAEQGQSKPRGRALLCLCSCLTLALPPAAEGPWAAKVLCKGKVNTPLTNLCKPLGKVPCSTAPLSPRTPGLDPLSYEGAEGNQALSFYSIAASVIEHPPQYIAVDFSLRYLAQRCLR